MKFAVGSGGAAAFAVLTARAMARADPEPTVQPAEFSLSLETLEISYEAARLSNISYAGELAHFGEREAINNGSAVCTHFSHPDYEDYEYVNFYTQEPDQAVVAKRDDICYVAFRGTNANIQDWFQNIDPDSRLVHRNNDTALESCEVRAGFVDFLDSDAVQQGLADVLHCVDTISCEESSSKPCLVLTGHSQGGASATIASILLHWLNPTIVTFGQPLTLDDGCDSVPSERYYRYINSIKEQDEDDDIAFDPIVFASAFWSGSKHYGHAILLGEDTKAVKYLGMDEAADFEPSFLDRQNEIAAHYIGSSETDNQYDARIGALLREYPIRTDGFSNGTFCDRAYHELCASGWCSPSNECAAYSGSGALASAASVLFVAAAIFVSSFSALL